MHGLGDNQADIMGEAIRKPLTRVRDGIGMTERGLHPHLAFAYFNRADGQVICPQVEGAAAFEIEASVVPMTGQDPVDVTAALEREAHVWATIVECEDASAVVDKEDRTMDAVHNQPPFGFRAPSRLAASVNSWTGASMSTPPAFDSLGSLPDQHRHLSGQTLKASPGRPSGSQITAYGLS